MISWIADHATMFYWLLALVAAGFVIAWYLTRRIMHLRNAGAVVGVMALLFLLTRLVVTDREQIENNLRALADAVVARQPEKFVGYLAKDFKFSAMSREEVKAYAMEKAKGHVVTEIRLRDIDVKELDQEQQTAKVEFRMYADGKDVTFAAFCISTFAFEEGTWKMVTIRFRHVVNTAQPIGIGD